MTAANKEAPQAAAKPTDADYRHRFFQLDTHLTDVVVWASLLDKVIEDMSRLPAMSRREIDIADGELNRVNDALKEAIERLDAIYYARTNEEAA